MSILKIKEVGDEATMTIQTAEVVTGKYGEQFKFSDGTDDLYVPYDSALRQFDRLDFTEHGEPDLAKVVGETLTFSRSASNKPGVNYWNINVAGNGKPPVAKPNPAKTPTPFASNVPEKLLSPLLQNAEAEDNAELAAKVGVDLTKFSKDLALYTALTEFVTQKIAPLYGTEIGMSPESAVAAVATLYIQAHR